MGTNGILHTEADKYLIAQSVVDIVKEYVLFGVKDVSLTPDAVLLSSVQLIKFFKIRIQRISFILLVTRTSKKKTSATTSDEMSCCSSNQKFSGVNFKKEKHIDSLDEISTDFLNENDKQQSPSFSIKRNEDYIHMKAILKSLLFSAYEEFIDTKIGLEIMKENSPKKNIVGHLNINSLRNKL